MSAKNPTKSTLKDELAKLKNPKSSEPKETLPKLKPFKLPGAKQEVAAPGPKSTKDYFKKLRGIFTE